MNKIEGRVEAKHARVAIVAARFNSFVVDRLVEGAVDTLKRIGQVQEDHITLVQVPGAYELPVTAKRLAMTQKYDAIIALGAIVRGDTPHFDFVAGECASGLSQVMNTHQIPVAFGVITTETVEQAIDRSGCKVGNKGAEVTLAALEMIDVLRQIDAKETV